MSFQAKDEKEQIPQKIVKIMEETKADFDEVSTIPRFGFFSIPPNQIIGDRFYSLKKEFNHKVVDHKVISEKRGIFTTPGKSGKGHDAYFQSLDTTDEGVQNRLIEGWKHDYMKHLEKVQKQKAHMPTPIFKYPGVQHYKDEFDQNPVERNFPIDKEKPRIAKIIDGKVITEKRGIFTQPMKKGFNNTPGIYFSYTPLHENNENKINEELKNKMKKKRPQSSIPLQRAYRTAFKPASLKKNECFSNIRETYGYEDKYFDNLKKMSDIDRKNSNKKYMVLPPPGSVKHMRPFSPAHLGKTGRDGLFDQRIWDCPQIPEKRVIVNQREKKEYEKAHRKEPFKYNIMQEQTRFSPPILTNKLNMRNNYPCIFGK
jgi:hypothetical protein